MVAAGYAGDMPEEPCNDLLDDMYSLRIHYQPVVQCFTILINNGTLPSEVTEFLFEAWKEILDT